MFAKMPQQKLLEPTSLRRSPRFLNHSKPSPSTLKPINPKNGSSSNSTKSCKTLKISDNGYSVSKNFRKPANGSSNSAKNSNILEKLNNGLKNSRKSVNGSRKKARLSEVIDCPRRSPRFCNEVKFSIELHCSNNSRSGDSVDCPATPIGVGEKKSMLVNDTDTSDSCVGGLLNFDRRVTRSCSRLAKAKVEAEKVTKKLVEGRNLFEGKAGGSKLREHPSSAKLSKGKEKRGRVEVGKVEESKSCAKGRKVRSSVKLVSCNKGKDKRGGDCKGINGGSERMRLDSVWHRVARGGRQRRHNNGTECDKKLRKTGDSFKVVEVLDGRITRSASKQLGRQIEPHCHIMEGRITRSASKQAVVRKAEKSIRDIDVKGKKTHDCVNVDIDKHNIESIDPPPLSKLPGKVERNKEVFTMDTKLTGVKRKRNQAGLQDRTNKGWTKEQELELHKAYFTAKPSPHFWKRVAKLVPGKSAQECFDKVHSDNQTPVCSKASLRAKKYSPLSGIELFDSAKKKSKKTSKAKRKSHMGRKTVRHLLQKYCHVNQDSGTDLFSILEPSANPSVEGLNLTPEHPMRSPDSSSKSRGRYSSGHKKRLSRLSGTSESLLTSPPVLKKVKNMVLHEKYIDQLHTREHKRKLSFSRYMKSAQNQKVVGEENSIHLKDIIKNAKETLVSEAKDVINKYRHSQANIMEGASDSEEFFSSEDEDDETVV